MVQHPLDTPLSCTKHLKFCITNTGSGLPSPTGGLTNNFGGAIALFVTDLGMGQINKRKSCAFFTFTLLSFGQAKVCKSYV